MICERTLKAMLDVPFLVVPKDAMPGAPTGYKPDMMVMAAPYQFVVEYKSAGTTAQVARAKRSDCDLAFRVLRGVDAKAFLDGLQFHDSTLRKLQDSVDAASGLRNTGEQQGALISAGLFDRRFAAHGRLTMPVLVLAGRYDGVIGVDAARELARTLPNAGFVEYERSAHFPYLEEPDRFARDVIAFLTAPRN